MPKACEPNMPGVGAVISHGGIDMAAHGCQEHHQGTEAISLGVYLTRAFRQLGHSVQGVFISPTQASRS